jgi:Rad3-related DNA helicase
MILPDREPGPDLEGLFGQEVRGAVGWTRAEALPGLAFVTLWATGPDPARDGLFRVQAVRRTAPGASWEALDVSARPFGTGGPEDEAGSATARMAREFGVTAGDLQDAGTPTEAMERLLEFVGELPVVAEDAPALDAWRAALAPDRPGPERLLDLPGLARFLAPGRHRKTGGGLVEQLVGSAHLAGRPSRAIGPGEVRAALGTLVGEFLARDETDRAILAHGTALARAVLAAREPAVEARISMAVALAELPTLWRDDADGLYPLHPALRDGALTDAVRAYPDLEGALQRSTPGWTREYQRYERVEPIPSYPEEEIALDTADRRTVDEIFQEHLPRMLATDGGEPSYREGQHAVAATIAEGLGRRELLLVHAPTGTGKTLAYLVPALLWALRNDARVAVATYTRALQEQAMARDVPLALRLLDRAGAGSGFRVSQLKGRRNYLCWRALRLQAPTGEEPPEDVLAWTALALFGLADPDGDLDRFPLPSPWWTTEPETWRRATGRLLNLARAAGGCCSSNDDLATCGASVSRERAKRVHVVVTNQAFALARRDMFRMLVFDECEHLHGQAQSAFSTEVTLRAVRELLDRARGSGGSRRSGVLERIHRAAASGSPVEEGVLDALDRCTDCVKALDSLQREAAFYKAWRVEQARDRQRADEHSLFREFVLEHDSRRLVEAQGRLAVGLLQLGAGLALLTEHLDALPTRGVLRLRRRLDLLRADVEETRQAVDRWIPRENGEVALRRETFHDLEETPAGDDVLAARVLLPNEHLGRHYFPDLHGAVLLSATTWLRDGFEAAEFYLGLERAAHPAEDEDRAPSQLRTFRAPDPFDYGRVVVTAPRDAPPVRQGKDAFLDYVARFVGFLTERTRGRMLVLFTNAEDCRRTGEMVAPFLAERRVPLFVQGRTGAAKEELSGLFREQVDSVLFGLDTFWFGADFPGETLQYLVIVRLPYGVPDRYHHAQCAALGTREQRRQIYMPRALARFRQGFGRLLRKERDRGCVFLLDARVLDPRNKDFLRELPLRGSLDETGAGLAKLVRGDTDLCLREALSHMDMLADVRRRGLERSFVGWTLAEGSSSAAPEPRREPEVPRIRESDVPY